ncbi:MAG: hypothetical protein GXZ09_04820 [Syntrophomonadaceae bacterium]|jgi:hypothetical protein|nr:hypothetical protein [Syntrophomonadaceae bacterium]
MAKRGTTAVADKFQAFLDNLAVEHTEFIMETFRTITRQLNQHYYGIRSDSRNAHFIGSYGRGTAIKGVANINILYELPQRVQKRLEVWQQKAPRVLIQEVRELIEDVFPMVHLSNQCHIIIPSLYQLQFEIIPAFQGSKRNHIYPDPNNIAGWSTFNPLREIEVLEESNFRYTGKTKHLARMMRAWKVTRKVPISGMLLDTLVVTFMDEWENNDTSFGYYGVMGRDFLEYLAGRRKNQEIYYAQGSNRELPSPDDFGAQANEDYKLAVQAVEYEFNDHHYEANKLWRVIYGDLFPM